MTAPYQERLSSLKKKLRKSSYKGCEWNAIKTGRDIQSHPKPDQYYQNAIEQSETGTVLIVGDGIARVSGLTNWYVRRLLSLKMAPSEWLRTWKKTAFSVVLFGSDQGISEGQTG